MATMKLFGLVATVVMFSNTSLGQVDTQSLRRQSIEEVEKICASTRQRYEELSKIEDRLWTEYQAMNTSINQRAAVMTQSISGLKDLILHYRTEDTLENVRRSSQLIANIPQSHYPALESLVQRTFARVESIAMSKGQRTKAPGSFRCDISSWDLDKAFSNADRRVSPELRRAIGGSDLINSLRVVLGLKSGFATPIMTCYNSLKSATDLLARSDFQSLADRLVQMRMESSAIETQKELSPQRLGSWARLLAADCSKFAACHARKDVVSELQQALAPLQADIESEKQSNTIINTLHTQRQAVANDFGILKNHVELRIARTKNPERKHTCHLEEDNTTY